MSGVAEASGFLGCHAVSLGKYLPTCQSIVLPSKRQKIPKDRTSHSRRLETSGITSTVIYNLRKTPTQQYTFLSYSLLTNENKEFPTCFCFKFYFPTVSYVWTAGIQRTHNVTTGNEYILPPDRRRRLQRGVPEYWPTFFWRLVCLSSISKHANTYSNIINPTWQSTSSFNHCVTCFSKRSTAPPTASSLESAI